MFGMVVHGLWFSIVYISFWEWCWRRHYKESMISIKKGMGDDIISNLFLLAAKIFLWIIGLFITFAIYMAFTHHS